MIEPAAAARDALVGVLTDNARKPPRVLAKLVADHLDALGLLDHPEPTRIGDEGSLVLMGRRPEPPSWLRFARTLDDEPPVAVTRNRTDTALRHLGLDPTEVRAVVVERDYLRVYRWTDRTESSGQTMPILKEPA